MVFDSRTKTKFALFILAVFLISLFSPVGITIARTSEDVEEEIQQKEGELEKINDELEQAQNNLNQSEDKKNKASGTLAELEADINLIEDQIEYNKVKIRSIEENKKLKELEKEKREVVQRKQLEEAYISWKSEDDKFVAMIVNSENPVKSATYYELITSDGQKNIETLANELNELEAEFADFEKEYSELQKDFALYEEQIAQKRAEIAQINKTIKEESQKIASTKQQIDKTKTQIDQLYDEQKALLEEEAEAINDGDQNGGTQPIQEGEYYFSGRGRDAVQGHGVGMSQNGALGAALAGWTYEQIIEFYYPGAKVQKYTTRTTLKVVGYGTMDIETYVSGIGEVPSYGCEDLGVSFGDKGYWGCWPKESVKAQIVAARSYALSYTSGGAAICTNTYCQVYNGGTAKEDLAKETEYEVAVVGGQPIKAFYSANNNQGAGTANNDTIWANRSGYGTPYSYLRSVNDNSFYYPAAYTGCGGGDCSTWSYRTNSYSVEQIQSMVEWTATNSSNSSNRAFANEVLQNVGNINSLSFVRDPSGRVKRINISGDKGSDEMAGWFFKSAWNIWVYNVKPSGQTDYIYSLTFYMLKG